MNSSDGRDKLFICYSHEDVRWLDQVKRQLQVLEAEGLVSLCDDSQVPRLFGQHEQAGMKIYPLLVRPCPWEQVGWLKKLQLRPQNAKRQVTPVSAFAGAAREQVLVNVANEIARLVKSAA